MGVNPIIGTVGGSGGGLLRLHSNCFPPRHCDPYGTGHSGAAFSHPYSTHGHLSSNVSPGNNGAHCYSYTGLS